MEERLRRPRWTARYEELESLGQVVKADEEFALRRFEEAGESEPRRRGITEQRVVAAVGASLNMDVRDLRESKWGRS